MPKSMSRTAPSSSMSTFRGVNPLVSYPRIPGHELGCTIEKVGAAVPAEFRMGQNVLVHPWVRGFKYNPTHQYPFAYLDVDRTGAGSEAEGARADASAPARRP